MNRYGTNTRSRMQSMQNQCPKAATSHNWQSCRMDTGALLPLPLAMAYVPVQTWGETYTPEQALCRGTIFPVLDLPFTRGGC